EGLEVDAAATSFVYVDLAVAMEADAGRLPLLALLVITFVVALDVRTFIGTGATLAALLVGMLATLGAMGVFGFAINFYNLVVMPAVLGLGIDASIHLWHARSHPPGGLGARATAKGAILSSMTTVGAFAGLLVAGHPGLRSIAEVG